MSNSPFAPIEDIVAAIARGEMVVMVDDEDRENEGDLIMAAEFATPEKIAFIVRHTSGVVVAPLSGDRCDDLRLPLMVEHNTESHRTAFTVSVDLIEGTTTGISASDRSATLRALADPNTGFAAFARPGHIFPLRAREGGVLKRAGHTEAAVDLATLAGLHPSGVICEILNEDGSMARLPELIELKKKFGLHMVSIAQLIEFRHRRERLVELVAETPFRSAWGEFRLRVYRSLPDGRQHLVFALGQPDGSPTLVRVQRENVLGDLFRGEAFGGGASLAASFAAVAKAGKGVIVHVAQPAGGARRPRRPAPHPAHHEQPAQGRGPRGLRPRDRRAGALLTAGRPFSACGGRRNPLHRTSVLPP